MMLREDAIRKLRKLLGPKLYWCVGKRPTSEEARAAALEDLKRLRDEKTAVDEEERALLAAIPELQALRAKRRELAKQIDAAQGEAGHYRYSVGVNIGWAVEIKAVGDSWEDVLRKIEAKGGK